MTLLLLLAACDGSATKDSAAGGDGYVPEKPPLVINEFLAKSEAVYADGAGEFDNWIELYNTGDEIVQFDGLYLTDDEETPTKWALPAGQGIDAGGFALVWCDNQPEQGDDHATFKLSGNGEFISIYYVEDGYDPVAVDPIEYGDQAVDVSYARVPDGSMTWQAADPTPNASNGS